jgi:hypothetical protein
VVLSLVADYVLLNFQASTNLMRATKAESATAPAIKFNTCYLLDNPEQADPPDSGLNLDVFSLKFS